jgi:hypothetical protein
VTLDDINTAINDAPPLQRDRVAEPAISNVTAERDILSSAKIYRSGRTNFKVERPLLAKVNIWNVSGTADHNC